MMTLGIFGSALLFSDGMITPSMSVLSAVEGLQVATTIFNPFILPIAIMILTGLFSFQKRGTARVGCVFGPVMLLWFITLSIIGLYWIFMKPGVLLAFDPIRAYRFFLKNRFRGFVILGAVFLVVTGGEALYEDIGHFGKKPIRCTWFFLVFPALALNYTGQGALLLLQPEAMENPFFRLVPMWGLYPMVVLSTAATVIASQAVITGVFSLTRQAVQLGYIPRLEIRHSSEYTMGQVYVPSVNWLLFFATVLLVLGFGSSSSLAAAYGVAVSTTMALMTVLAFQCACLCWGWSFFTSIPVFGILLAIDLAFFGSNILKVREGRWFPLLVAFLIFLLMTTWNKGRLGLRQIYYERTISFEEFMKSLKHDSPPRVTGTAVYIGNILGNIPLSFLHNLKHNKVLHRWIFFLVVLSGKLPKVPRHRRMDVRELGDGFVRITVRYGFKESSKIPSLLQKLVLPGWNYNPLDITYFLGRETLRITSRGRMARWQKSLFLIMHRNVQQARFYYRMPPNRVVELGTQIEF